MVVEVIKLKPNIINHPRVVSMARHLLSSKEFTLSIIDHEMMDICKDELGWKNGDIPATQFVTPMVVRHIVVSVLITIWSSATGYATDGVLKSMTIKDLDQLSGIDGIGEAMELSGWAAYDEQAGGVVLLDPLFTDAK